MLMLNSTRRLQTFLMVWCFAVPIQVSAATFEVNTFGDGTDLVIDGRCVSSITILNEELCSLRAAIQEANANDEDDVIILPNGDTGETNFSGNPIIEDIDPGIPNSGGHDNLGLSGDFDILKGTITIIGQGPEVTRVGRQVREEKADRIFDVHPGATLILQDLTVHGGDVENILNVQSEFLLREETEGGGIRSIQSNLILHNVHVTNNRGAGFGAGIYSLMGYLEVNDSQIYRNHEYTAGNVTGVGTGITLNGGKAVIKNTLIWDNPHQQGFNVPESDTPIGVMPPPIKFSNPTTDEGATRGPWTLMGGGIYSFGDLTIENSAIIGNRAKVDGGGIYHGVGALVIKNTTISGNVADRSGGGLFIKREYVGEPRELFGIDIPVNLLHVTMINNHALEDDETIHGIFVDQINGGDNNVFGGYVGPSQVGILGGNDIAISGQGGGQPITELQMANSIVGSCGFFEGKITSLGNNLSANSDCGLDHTGDITNTDPLLAAINFNGSFRPTFRPLSGSPAINGANDWYCPQAGTDQRGMLRPLTDCYIGAYEEVPLTAVSQPYVVQHNAPLTNVLRTSLSDNLGLEFQIVTPPAKGRVGLLDEESVGPAFVNGMFSYVPHLGATGSDSFTFKAIDTVTLAESNVAEISLNITSEQVGPLQEEVPLELITVAPGASTSPAIVLTDNELSAEVADADYDLSLGIVFFSVSDIPQDTGLGYVDVQIQLPEILSPNLHNLTGPELRKLDKFGRWHTLPGSSSTQTSGFVRGLETGFIPNVGRTFAWIITVRLYDNDIFDNDDRVGFINDPIAIGFAKDPANFNGRPASFIPANNEWNQQEQTGGAASLSFTIVLLLALLGILKLQVRRLNNNAN